MLIIVIICIVGGFQLKAKFKHHANKENGTWLFIGAVVLFTGAVFILSLSCIYNIQKNCNPIHIVNNFSDYRNFLNGKDEKEYYWLESTTLKSSELFDYYTSYVMHKYGINLGNDVYELLYAYYVKEKLKSIELNSMKEFVI